MRNIRYLLFIAIFYVTSCAGQESMHHLTARVFKLAEKQSLYMAHSLGDSLLPRSLDHRGNLISSDIYWWCSGFYPGTLWYIYEYSGDKKIKSLAEHYTELLTPLKEVTTDHDIGFQLMCSFGNGLRLTGNAVYRNVICTGAHSLATRFNPKVGCIRSWDWAGDGWKYPVIIDNMMNLELLLQAAKISGDDLLYHIACVHANTTMKNHFRSDYSTFHLVDYDPETGEVRRRQTVQGYSDESAWSRGQSWALYSYTMMYRMTESLSYLNQAVHIADYLIKRLPKDGIPHWDYDSPDIPHDLKDASAGAVMASALIELSNVVSDMSKRKLYSEIAEKQLRVLASPAFLAEEGKNGYFLLKHSVGNKPGGSEVDVPLTYADYYFLEGLLRYKKYNK